VQWFRGGLATLCNGFVLVAATRVEPRAMDTTLGSYLRRIDSCIAQLKAQGPYRTCIVSKEEEASGTGGFRGVFVVPEPRIPRPLIFLSP